MVAIVLEELRITGLGVIADATLPLADGFTVVTGETGAGKTMVVAGLGLLFGGRADPSRIRHGAERAIVEGRLRTAEGDAVRDRAEEAGGETDEDGGLVISRSVTADNGRSRAYLGGRSVPVGALADVGQRTLTLHGQSDQMRLLRPAEQRSALDRYGGETVARLLADYQRAYTAWQDVVAELADRTAHARERAQEADMLRHGLEEISAADPQPAEDDELKAESVRLEHAEDLRTAAQTAHAALAGDPSGGGAYDEPDVSGLLGAARRALGQVSDRDEALAALAVRCDELSALAAEVATDLAAYATDIEADPARLAAVHERRAVLAGLTRKYADTVDGVREWAEKATARLASLDTSEEALAALAEKRDALAEEVGRLTGELHAARAKTGEQFGAAVTAELTGLAMPHAVVEAAVTLRPGAAGQPVVSVDGSVAGGDGPVDVTVGPEGGDDVEIRLIAGPGAPPLPLQRGASGGELSRVMLAVEVVFAGSGGPPTMVFDEVDAGVGGKAAVEVGRRLARLARSHQVLVVTHLPQVAAFADQHLVVVKDSDGTVTTSGVRRLDETERARELSRMLAGLEGSELGIAHAEELLVIARSEKR